MNRRTFIAATPALLAAPLSVEAQSPPKLFRIGLLGGSLPTSPAASHIWGAFFQGLRELGYVEGQNIVFEHRFYGGNIERLPALAAELARLPVDVIVAGAVPAPEAAKRATATIPIVMMYHTDPVGSGLVASLARPGANVTGLSLLSPELRGKQLQLLKEVVPGLMTLALLVDPTVPNARAVREWEVEARALMYEFKSWKRGRRTTSAPVTRRPCALSAPAPAHHASAPWRHPLRAVRTPPLDAARPSRVGTRARRSRF